MYTTNLVWQKLVQSATKQNSALEPGLVTGQEGAVKPIGGLLNVYICNYVI